VHVISRSRTTESRVTQVARRALDIVISSVGLVLAAPVLALLSVLVRWDSSGPAFFRQVRVGRGEQLFILLKLRTMRMDGDDAEHRAYVAALQRGEGQAHGELFKLVDDPRVTRIGRWLRRTSLDELPQLWNVLRGDMALVGPRPMPPHELATMPLHGRLRHRVRPGITGLWQVSGRSRLSYAEMIELDLQYAQHPGFWRDLAILLRTPRAVMGGTA
jgi:lipopolysaccharide/colanic/teichoic acid biosynthesis glycosyltransferase